MGFDWISFTTDYGLEDGYVAACVGVIARITPDAKVTHVTHAVPPQDVRRGATVLAQTVPYLPKSVHLAVVDPAVGTERRAVAVVAARGLLVGPDNGLLVAAAEALGGIEAVHELTEQAYRLPCVSATFHGRDVFAPAAAHLASGVAPERLGPALDPTTLVRLVEPKSVVLQGKLSVEVLSTDRFGNIQLAAHAEELETLGAAARIGGHKAVVGRTFADADSGALVVFVDSAGYVSVAVNGGSATGRLGLKPGETVVLTAIP